MCVLTCIFVYGFYVFVDPKYVLNVDGETSMFTLIIYLLHGSHSTDGGRLEPRSLYALYRLDQRCISGLCVDDMESTVNRV